MNPIRLLRAKRAQRTLVALMGGRRLADSRNEAGPETGHQAEQHDTATCERAAAVGDLRGVGLSTGSYGSPAAAVTFGSTANPLDLEKASNCLSCSNCWICSTIELSFSVRSGMVGHEVGRLGRWGCPARRAAAARVRTICHDVCRRRSNLPGYRHGYRSWHIEYDCFCDTSC